MLGQGGSPVAKKRAKRWLRRPTCRVTARTLSHHVLFTDELPSTVKEEAFRDVFYHDCPTRAIPLRVPKPTAPGQTPVQTTTQNFGWAPCVYIRCLQDRSVSSSFQTKRFEALPCDRIITMDPSHSPFLAAPEELVNHLISLPSSEIPTEKG